MRTKSTVDSHCLCVAMIRMVLEFPPYGGRLKNLAVPNLIVTPCHCLRPSGQTLNCLGSGFQGVVDHHLLS